MRTSLGASVCRDDDLAESPLGGFVLLVADGFEE
jgi:hypothetical protein